MVTTQKQQRWKQKHKKSRTYRPNYPLKFIHNKWGRCMTFGGKNKKISRLFQLTDKFDNLDNINNISSLGETGVNGTLNRFTYKNNGYTFYAIFKSAKFSYSDNLYYEFFVGKYFINKLNLKYPCFIETYHIYYNFHHNHYDADNKKYTIKIENLDDLIQYSDPVPDIIYCLKSKYLAILVQDIPDAQTLRSYILNHFIQESSHFIITDNLLNQIQENIFAVSLVQILFQIYCPLSQLENQFTHYDLHTDNILLYELNKGEFITMRYIYADNTIVEFDTSFIAKIIDYGRCFFDNGSKSTVNFIQDKLSHINCNQPINQGFNHITKGNSSYYLNPRIKNNSHDLRLLSMIKYHYKKARNNHSIILNNFFRNVIYNNFYGTATIDPNFKRDRDKIYDVMDAALSLRNILSKDYYCNIYNENKKNRKIVGTLTIYVDNDLHKSMIHE